MSDERCVCAPGPAGGDPQCVIHRDLYEARSAVRRELAVLLRRFERPRTYAGDYHGDFADRILVLLGYAELRTIVRDLAANPELLSSSQGGTSCSLCDGYPGPMTGRVEHAESCPWRRAKELLADE